MPKLALAISQLLLVYSDDTSANFLNNEKQQEKTVIERLYDIAAIGGFVDLPALILDNGGL